MPDAFTFEDFTNVNVQGFAFIKTLCSLITSLNLNVFTKFLEIVTKLTINII